MTFAIRGRSELLFDGSNLIVLSIQSAIRPSSNINTCTMCQVYIDYIK
jgi:hypothetical protein